MGYYCWCCLSTGAIECFKLAAALLHQIQNSASAPLPFIPLSTLCNDNASYYTDPFGVWGCHQWGDILFGFSLSHFMHAPVGEVCLNIAGDARALKSFSFLKCKIHLFLSDYTAECVQEESPIPRTEKPKTLNLPKLNPRVWSLHRPHQAINQNLTNLTTTALSGHSVHRELTASPALDV